jgi:hypothetical protein
MTGEWIKKMSYKCTMEFYSDMKKNEIILFAGKWIKLKNFMLGQVNQAQKVKVACFLSYIEDRPIS